MVLSCHGLERRREQGQLWRLVARKERAHRLLVEMAGHLAELRRKVYLFARSFRNLSSSALLMAARH